MTTEYYDKIEHVAERKRENFDVENNRREGGG